MRQLDHFVPNGDGWLLHLKQTYDPERLQRHLRPIAILPGYGMNAFIFGYHPTGKSMEVYWAEMGFEVWSINLRTQGRSKCMGGSRRYGFYDAGVTDTRCALEYVARNTESSADRVDGVGCSLGGTYLYAYLATLQERNLLGSLVAMGAPLRWVDVHPLLKSAFSSPRLAGALSIRGTRQLAVVAIPLLTRLPKLLHVYLHPRIVDISKMREMVQTVENPNPTLNRESAEWGLAGDLVVGHVNVTQGLRKATNPLLIVLSNADGIVPEATALTAFDTMGTQDKEILRVGTDAVPVAHADMFISDISQEWVFEPLGQWLLSRNPAPRKARSRPKGKKTAKGTSTARKKAGAKARTARVKKKRATPPEKR